MNGSTLTLGLVAGLAVLGAARRGSRSIPSSPSSPLDLPPFVGLDAPAGFYYRARGSRWPRPSSVILLGDVGGNTPGPILKIYQWRFPHNPNDTFRSPLVNFDNMHHMGAYRWRNLGYSGDRYDTFGEARILVQRVIDGQKPAAVIDVSGGLSDTFGGADKASRAKRKEAERLYAHAKKTDLIVGELKEVPWFDEKSYKFTVARPGTYAENFDLDAWTRSYAGYGIDVGRTRLGMGHTIEDVPLWKSLDVFSDQLWNRSPMELGLLLGFPICTTVHFGWGALPPLFKLALLKDWPYAPLLSLLEEKARLDARMTDIFPDWEEEVRQSVGTVQQEIADWTYDHDAPDAWTARWEDGRLTREIEAVLRKDLTPLETRELLRQRRGAR